MKEICYFGNLLSLRLEGSEHAEVSAPPPALIPFMEEPNMGADWKNEQPTQAPTSGENFSDEAQHPFRPPPGLELLHVATRNDPPIDDEVGDELDHAAPYM